MKIKAVYLERPLQIVKRQVEKPKVKGGEVLLKIKSVGVCGSDIHYYERGKIGNFVVRKPLILGHECSGEVAELGRGVINLNVGDRVALEPGIPCRMCDYCKRGRYNLCPNVRFMATPPIDGAFVEYVAHPADFCFKIPENISYDEATLFEPLAVGLYALERADIRPEHRVLILGAGPVGLATLQSALCTKGVDTTIVDLYKFRLNKAKELGAKKIINARNFDILKQLSSEFDVVFETAGNVITTQQTVKLARNGGKVVLVGLSAQEEINFSTNQVVSKELDILGVFRYANMYPRAVRLAQKGGVDLKSLITQRFSFGELEEALKFARDNKNSCIKAIVQVSH